LVPREHLLQAHRVLSASAGNAGNATQDPAVAAARERARECNEGAGRIESLAFAACFLPPFSLLAVIDSFVWLSRNEHCADPSDRSSVRRHLKVALIFLGVWVALFGALALQVLSPR
jgi:hypothetical protein